MSFEYELDVYLRARVTLLVVRARTVGLGPVPPPRPAFASQGRAIAAWQEGDLLYVLVVEDPAGGYRRFVNPDPGPLA